MAAASTIERVQLRDGAGTTGALFATLGVGAFAGCTRSLLAASAFGVSGLAGSA